MGSSVNWYKIAQEAEQIKQFLSQLIENLRVKYPVSDLHVFYNSTGGYIELANIEFPPEEQDKGYGTQLVKDLQSFARNIGKAIVLRPSPQPRKKGALQSFYRNLGFVNNKGRNIDYQFSSPFSSTMYWRPQ